MTKTNSFKQWLREEEALDGVENLAKSAKSAFDKGKAAQQDADKKKETKAKEDAAKVDKENHNNVIKDINTHVASLFSNFPEPVETGSPEDLLTRYPTRKAALQAFEIYKNMAKTIAEIQKGFNDRLVSTKRTDKGTLAALVKRAKQDAESGTLDRQIEVFARSEAKFFTELLNIPETEEGNDAFDKMRFDKGAFIKRLSDRFSKTESNKVNQTIEALNTLFIYLEEEFTQYAKVIGESGKQRPKV